MQLQATVSMSISQLDYHEEFDPNREMEGEWKYSLAKNYSSCANELGEILCNNHLSRN